MTWFLFRVRISGDWVTLRRLHSQIFRRALQTAKQDLWWSLPRERGESIEFFLALRGSKFLSFEDMCQLKDWIAEEMQINLHAKVAALKKVRVQIEPWSTEVEVPLNFVPGNPDE